MKKILVISGKGGTGKTTVAASFASLAKEAAVADCDVDAPDLHLLLQPKNAQETPFYALKKAVRSEKKCISCAKCINACRYGAIDDSCRIDPMKCDGCASCAYVCPVGAITMEECKTGRIISADTRFGPLIYGVLNAGEEASGKLVAAVKKKAEEIAQKEKKEYLIIDGSPGIGCPVIASLSGVDLAVIVTEPTVSGLHDLDRVLSVAKRFGVKTCVCVNKCDLSLEKTEEIEEYCKENGVYISGRIRYDPCVYSALSELKIADEYGCPCAVDIRAVWDAALSLCLKVS
jgi:MinD superfamily P-loop ATPase